VDAGASVRKADRRTAPAPLRTSPILLDLSGASPGFGSTGARRRGGTEPPATPVGKPQACRAVANCHASMYCGAQEPRTLDDDRALGVRFSSQHPLRSAAGWPPLPTTMQHPCAPVRTDHLLPQPGAGRGHFFLWRFALIRFLRLCLFIFRLRVLRPQGTNSISSNETSNHRLSFAGAKPPVTAYSNSHGLFSQAKSACFSLCQGRPARARYRPHCRKTLRCGSRERLQTFTPRLRQPLRTARCPHLRRNNRSRPIHH